MPHPFRGLPPPSLLDSLISLSREISAVHSAPFPIHNNIFAEALRVNALLVAFLESVRDDAVDFPTELLWDLFDAFRRLRGIFSDSARLRSRIRILMGSDRLRTEFRSVFRSVAASLASLPLDEMLVEDETVEYCVLARKHAGAFSARARVEASDEATAKEVGGVLAQFRNGTVPDENSIRAILDFLGIHTWWDCDREVRLLEDEIDSSLSISVYERSDIVLMQDLFGFMIYSRCVLFEVVRDDDDKKGEVQKGNFDYIDRKLLRCPISLQLMKDPVTLSTGHTYDSESISRWFKSGNWTCPVTGTVLDKRNFIPNLAVKNLVQKIFKGSDCQPEKGKVILTDSQVSGKASRLIVKFLRSELTCGVEGGRRKATYEFQLLSGTRMFRKSHLVDSDVIPWLLHLLGSWDRTIQEDAMAAILNLTMHPRGRKVVFEVGGVVQIVYVLDRGFSNASRNNAAAALFILSAVDEYREAITVPPEAFPAIVRLLTDGTSEGKISALSAIFGLLLNPENHQKAIAAGALPKLLVLLSSKRETLTRYSLDVLASLAKTTEGSDAIMRSSAIASVVHLLKFSPWSAAKENCVVVLTALLNSKGKLLVAELLRFRTLMASLYTLLGDGSSRVGALINAITSFDGSQPARI